MTTRTPGMPIRPLAARALAIVLVAAGLFGYLLAYRAPVRHAALVSCGALAALLAIWGAEILLHGAAPPPDRPKGDSFDWGMHAFRGFAILCIALMHALSGFGFHKWTQAFLSSSTIYFLFISGYLCQHLHSRRPDSPAAYYRKKLLNVILPYLAMSVATAVLVRATGALRPGLLAPADYTLREFPRILLFGWAQPQYWYVPFVAVLFAVSPALVRTGDRTLVRISALAFALLLVFPSRGGWKITPETKTILCKFSYFTFYYLAGFLFARFRRLLEPHLKAYALPGLLLGLFLGLTVLFPDWFGPYVVRGAQHRSLQKLFFLVPLLWAATRCRSRPTPLLGAFADYSFAIFFLHHFFIADFVRLRDALLRAAAGIPCAGPAANVAAILLFIAFSLALAMLLKRATGRWSRSLTGA